VSRIFIIGAGTVGLATGRALRGAGQQVTFIESDPERLAGLCARGLDARPVLSLAGEPESFIVLTVPTWPAGAVQPAAPTLPAGAGQPAGAVPPVFAGEAQPGYDLTALRAAVRAVGRALAHADSPHIVVIRSTVPPGTTDGIVRHLLERVSGKREGAGFELACQPEFLRPGHADHDAQWPVLTVIGSKDRRIADRVAQELAPFGGVHQFVDSAQSAEMIKCVHVVQRAVNAGLWDELARVCRRWEIEIDPIAQALAQDGQLWDWAPPRTGRLTQTRAASGRRLPEEFARADAEGFLGLATDAGVSTPILAAALTVAGPERSLTDLLPRQDSAVTITLDHRTPAAPNGRP
jgi:UDPglucose 6-dehydrogenase